jgi:leader peptidase (prepilin peptidase)/N-methyltransferase
MTGSPPVDPVELLAVVFITLAGLAIGSFLNVVIWRVPRDESVVSPPSHCPGCDAPIRGRDNIPVLSWLLLRGRCRDCNAPISARYPGVELLTGALFCIVTLAVGLTWALPAYLYLTAVCVALAFIDLDTKRLPNVLTLPSYPVMAGLLLLPAVLDGAWSDYVRALLGGLALFVFYLVLALVYPAGMGMGDVKLAGVLGMALAWLGWGVWFVGTFAGFLLGAVVGLGLMLVRRAGRRTAIPFGPFMVAGTLLAIVFGQAIADWYGGLLTV